MWVVTLTQRYRVEGSLCSILASSAPAPQERLEAARQALSEARKQSSSLSEQVQTMRGELADLEVQRAEAEGQLQQLQEVRATMGPFCPRDAEALRMRRDLPCPHLIPNPGPASREEAWFIRPAPPLRRWRS